MTDDVKPRNRGGRDPGSVTKRKIEGAEWAKEILEQKWEEVDEVDPNPVRQRLKEQAREGVGNQPGQMPPPVFVHLMERAWGKVIDKVKMQTGGRPYESLSDEELAARLRALQSALKSEEADR